MKKPLSILLPALALAVLVLAPMQSRAAANAAQGPEDVVRAFYAWYIEAMRDDRATPEHDDAIVTWVSPCTVERLRRDFKKGIVDANYFLNTQDFEYDVFTRLMRTHPAVYLDDTLALVPVGGAEAHVLVFVSATRDGWRITKVEEGWPEY